MLLSVVARKLALSDLLLAIKMRMMRLDLRHLLLALLREADHSLVDYGLNLLKGHGTRVHVEHAANYLSALAVFLLVGGCHGLLDGVDHRLLRDATLLELAEH